MDIVNKLRDKRKVRVSMTFDKQLLDKIELFKKKHNLKTLSPIINLVVAEWINKELKLEESPSP